MKKKQSNGVSALSATPVYQEDLNEVIKIVNKFAGLNEDGSGDNIPANVYPVSDGEGGFIAGDLKKVVTTEGPNISLCPPDQYGPDLSFKYLTTGGYNYGVGNNIFRSLTTGSSNTAFGLSCLNSLGSGRNNSAYGTNALTGLIDGDYNSGVGNAAGGNRHHGDYNSYLGAYAGFTEVEDSITNSTAIGSYSKLTKNNQVVIGDDAVVELITRGVHINTHSVTEKNATATLTAAECLSGVITSTSAAAVALTLPSAADLIAVLNGGGQGTTFELIIDNSSGANSVTITPSATIAAITSPFTVTNPMIVTTAQKVGCFKFYFISSTAAVITRVW